MQTKNIFGLAALVAIFVVAPGRSASEQHLGGRWFLDEKDSATYPV